MKAVFVNERTLLRDSHIEPGAEGEWSLMPATVEAMRLLSTSDTWLFIWGDHDVEGEAEAAPDRQPRYDLLVKQVEAGGGCVDGIIACPHEPGDACKCWGDYPGAIWLPAAQFGLAPDECYVLADSARDVTTAYAAGARPLMVLCERTIGDVLGNRPAHKDFPIAPDLTAAAGYIAVENEINQRLGHARAEAPSVPQEQVLYSDRAALPVIRVTSARLEALQTRVRKSRFELRDIGRWLSFFVLGAVGLSLGIAYLLTHLYRIQPFPPFVYWITLQFIPRPLRGTLFIILGLGAIWLAIRSFYHSSAIQLLRRWRS